MCRYACGAGAAGKIGAAMKPRAAAPKSGAMPQARGRKTIRCTQAPSSRYRNLGVCAQLESVGLPRPSQPQGADDVDSGGERQ